MEEEKSFDQNRGWIILMYFCLSLSFVSSVTNMILTILNHNFDNIGKIITVVLLAFLSLGLIFMALCIKGKTSRIMITITSFFIILFSILQICFHLPKKDFVPNFIGKDIKELVDWADQRKILVEQNFEFSDTIEKYKIITQDIKENTNSKNVKKIVVTVSDGIDESKKATIQDMTGWKLDEVIAFIDKNHLTNVTILFEYNDQVEPDIIFHQDVVKEITRKEPITLKSSLGKKGSLKNVVMKKLIGLDTFHALIFLGRNDLSYEIVYTYSEEKEEGTILKQSAKEWRVVEREKEEPIILTVAKKNEITMVDFTFWNPNQITKWATNNRLKVEFQRVYDDTIKQGKVMEYSPRKGNTIPIDSTIYVTLSNGPWYMPKYTSLEEFQSWAKEYSIPYQVEYEYHSSISAGGLISSSHKQGQIIKNKDTIQLIISQGSSTFVPDFIGLTKKEAEECCKNANVICNFKYVDENQKYDTVTKQSISKETNVPVNTSITITLGK